MTAPPPPLPDHLSSSLDTATATRRRAGAALRFLGLAGLGSLLLALSAQITVPMWPVPATLQSLAVLILGALGGPWLGATSVALYLAEGAMGLPVFANGRGGIAVLSGPTAGYLIGFLPAAWLAGYAGQRLGRQILVLSTAHLLLFLPGVVWLAGFVGWARAFEAGFIVFIPGTIVKTALALALLRAARRRE